LKRCPDCDSVFPDAEQFCELDGTPLVSVDDAPEPLPAAPSAESSRALLPIGVVAGVLLGVLLSLVYFAILRQPAQENSNTTNSNSTAQQQQFLQPQQPAPRATASPSVEPSVEPSPSPTETPSPQNSATHVELSSSDPISTASGAKGRNPVVITLNTGTTIEADEAWQTGEGIWYRKHGVVALLDPKNVKAVEKATAEPQPSATKSPSP
jgi:cytoskeletal protein RodZ